MEVTIFKNIIETETPFYRDVDVALNRIKTGASKDLVKSIRAEKKKTIRQEMKKGLPAICFSGKFSKRSDSALIDHSGLICLDFDGYDKQKDMLADKERMSKDRYVYSVFVSPSGNGLKVLVKIPEDADNHKRYFTALDKHFNSDKFDKTSSNVSRVCYESYDPLIYINEHSSVWETADEPEYVEISKTVDRPTIPLTDENKIAEILIKWWTKKYPMNHGRRNENAYILAMALNEFGINESLARHILFQYEQEDFKRSEIETTIRSAYSKKEKFGTKYYEDEDRINEIRLRMKRGVPKTEIKAELKYESIDEDAIDNVVEKIETEISPSYFWSKNNKGDIKIDPISFKTFLEDNGFYKFYPDTPKDFIFVKIVNNLIDVTSENEIKDFILNYLLELDDMRVYNYFSEKTQLFKKDFLSLLSSIDIYFISDTKKESYLYYKNCAVKVTKDSVIMIDYLDLGGYVWRGQVIDRNFETAKVKSGFSYATFIANICDHDEGRIKSMESTIGFLLHGYKSPAYCPAVILNDEVISDHPEGGTGKGIFMNAISKMKKVTTVDGKQFSLDRGFPYQLVTDDTQVMLFDDARKHFDFERLFSIITEGVTVEKKYADAVKIPFNRSPKVAITTNYAIKGSGNSFERRKWELELHRYYHKDFTPLDEFGKMLFDEWNDSEYKQFDNYMIGCLQVYLNRGLIKSEFINLKVRKLSSETSHDFIEWCGLTDGGQKNHMLMPSSRVFKKELYDKFTEEYPDYAPRSKYQLSRKKFYDWLDLYSMFEYGVKPESGRADQGNWIRFRNKHELEKQGELI